MESTIIVGAFGLLALCAFLFYFGSRRTQKRCKRIAFFHPYCNAAGGGERVLWLAVRSLQQACKSHEIVIYCGDLQVTGDSIISKVENVFKIRVDKNIKFIYLRSRFLLEASNYPFLTLLLQSLASIIVAIEAIWKYCPDVYIDTLGCSFTHLVFKLCVRCKVVCYVHYPVVSSDMLQSVSSSHVSFNNRRFISNSAILTRMKIIYYNIFALIYGVVGRLADIIFVNSSWTKGHIIELWKAPSKTYLLFPPCNVANFDRLAETERKHPIIVSISQFRPEKNHSLQLLAFKLLLERLSDDESKECQLVIVGSCRNDDDEKRVGELRNECCRYGIESKVEFKTNVNFDELLRTVEVSKIGVHTMYNEHFGISIVELMAAGVIMVAHDSGGPKLDIIDHGVNGFLASSAEEYAEAFHKIITMSNAQIKQMQSSATKSMQRFSDDKFSSLFLNSLRPLLNLED